jgi:hypothetical protein
LRVLCIIALDTLHVLRHSQPLSRKRISELATFLDFQACTNAAWDHKDLCEAEYQAIRQRLEKAGLGSRIEEYLSQLRRLERRRPSIGGDHQRFVEVRSYREAVARLSLGTVVAIAMYGECLEEEIRAAYCDSDVETLFRIVMQCQIIDDVLDYTEDVSAGLPSFLTASASLPQAMELTAKAARSYAASPGCSSGDGVFPLRMALCVFTAVTKLVVRVADRRHRSTRQCDHSALLTCISHDAHRTLKTRAARTRILQRGYGTTHSQRLEDLSQRRARAEGRDPRDSGGDIQPARP